MSAEDSSGAQPRGSYWFDTVRPQGWLLMEADVGLSAAGSLKNTMAPMFTVLPPKGCSVS